MEKQLPPSQGIVAVMMLLNGMQLAGEFPARTEYHRPEAFAKLAPNDIIPMRRPWMIAFQQANERGGVGIAWQPLVLLDHEGQDDIKSFLRSQVLTIYRPRDSNFEKDYMRRASPSGIDIVSSLGAVGINVKA